MKIKSISTTEPVPMRDKTMPVLKSTVATQVMDDRRIKPLLVLVGQRVLQLRKAKGLSRREVSEHSGVSPRYLAQLESGEGNISIGLLKRISIALDRPMEALVAEDEATADDINNLVSLYRKADSATRAQILQQLDPIKLREQKAERICLIGLRGAGKSTLGQLLSIDLNIPFVELNHRIENLVGIPVAETMALYGQEGYRELEADAIDNISTTEKRVVLAAAGGIVQDNTTYNKVLSRFHTVWIKASPDEHIARVTAQGDLRPMAGNPQAKTQLRQILRAREAQYQKAEYHIDTSGRTTEQSRVELRYLLQDLVNSTVHQSK